MITKNYVEVPANINQDPDAAQNTWRDGKLIVLNEGRRHATIFIDHQQEPTWDEEGNESTRSVALPIRVEKPYTRATLINAAEMQAYSLFTAMDVASFNSSLARKSRLDPSDPEVTEHDSFIEWVKTSLTAIGITSD